jgi:hypothetical protein
MRTGGAGGTVGNGVRLGVKVRLGVRVTVGVGVKLGVGVMLGVRVGVGVAVAVAVRVTVGVALGVRVGVAVGSGVLFKPSKLQPLKASKAAALHSRRRALNRQTLGMFMRHTRVFLTRTARQRAVLAKSSAVDYSRAQAQRRSAVDQA